MKIPDARRINQTATSSSNEGPTHGTTQSYAENWDRIFGRKKREKTSGYTVIKYVNGKRVVIENAELKSRAECGLAPLKVTGI